MVLKEVRTKEEEEKFIKYEIECVKYHQQYAQKLGLQDCVVDEFDYDKAIKRLQRKYYRYLIEEDNNIIGMLECTKRKSSIDNKQYLYLSNIFIENQYRGQKLGADAFRLLREKFKMRIELECWYEIPANKFYEELEMRQIRTRYMIDYSNQNKQ